MQSDATMQVLAVVAAVALVLASRHLPRWWADRTAWERRPARRARVVVTSLAVVGGGVLVVVMATQTGPSSAAPDREASPDEVGGLSSAGPVPAPPDRQAPLTSSAGS